MRTPATLSADDCEILVLRELRRAGVEADGLRRMRGTHAPPGDAWRLDLAGGLGAYGRRWRALVTCLNPASDPSATDVDDARRRADALNARSVLMFTTRRFAPDAVERAHHLRIALFEIVQAQPPLLAAGLIQPGPLPAWVPEFTVEVITLVEGNPRRHLLEADEPELILRELRRPD